MLFGLAILIAAMAVWISIYRPVQPQPNFTQFWMLPANQPNNSCAVSIGIQSFESTSVMYRVVMTVNGIPVNAWSSISLAPQGNWVQSVPVKPDPTATISIDTKLYQADKLQTAYREAHLTMHGVKGQAQECTSGA